MNFMKMRIVLNLWIEKKNAIEKLTEFTQNYSIKAKYINAALESLGTAPLEQGVRLSNLILRPQLSYDLLKDHIPAMRENLARIMGVLPEQINVKATTEEGLGFTGQEAGMAAHAVCLLTETE